jgi:signal transduction histidine kinase/AraC-like DNA-binding protein
MNYFSEDGFIPNNFDICAHYKNKNGEIYFAVADGFVVFHPDKLKEFEYKPSVVLTELTINNLPVNTARDPQFEKSIFTAKEIVLDYSQKDISITFAALDYNQPDKNQYSFYLENYENDWRKPGTEHTAYYTNLDPGDYIFHVKGSNSNGVWNDYPTSLRIILNPPWWQTWWAYSMYTLIFIGLVFILRRYEMSRVHLKNQIRLDETKLKEREKVDQMKSTFFANISHEFRTPLTLILGPLSRLTESESDKSKKHSLEIMQRNGQRLLRLINQLLDFSRLESGKMKLKADKGDIVSFVKGILMSFQSLAEHKKITVRFISKEKRINLYFDREKAEKIFVNLLSNAFKFTPEYGRISVKVQNGEKDITIKVKDTGVGISPDKLPHIFNRFYQADDSLTRDREGTGIGLAFTKELVGLHHGSIGVMSTLNKGAEFTVTLKKGNKHLKTDQISEAEDRRLDTVEYIHGGNNFEGDSRSRISDSSLRSSVSGIQPPTSAGTSPTILVVEDNQDMSSYIFETLHYDFQVKIAVDGQEGIMLAKKCLPDLIISDLMMPKMDGYQLCDELKRDEKTSHIPIILLTAKAEKQDKLTGLQMGADDYLIKPFDSQELQIRIQNLIEQRQKLRDKFIKKLSIEPGEISVTSMDEAFLKKAFDVIKDNMDNGELDTIFFAREFGMSRSHLNAKLKALTGFATREFISHMRLKQAAKLIEANHGSISEIAYMVGFNSLSHFSKIFRKTFGMLPSVYNTQVKS